MGPPWKGVFKSGAMDTVGGIRRSAGSKWYFVECNVVPPFSTFVRIERRENKSYHIPSVTFSNCPLSSLLFRIDIAFLVVFSTKSNSM